jgi:hypothetical protein
LRDGDHPGTDSVPPGTDFRNITDSGATSDEILDNLQDELGGLPSSAAGDVLLIISAGGNDFNNSALTMVTTAATEAATANLRSNLAQMVSLVEDRYADADTEVLAVFLNIQDPTDGLASIPDQFDNGFCGMLQNPAFALVGELVLSNLGVMNNGIAAGTAASGAELADYYSHFQGHGTNASTADRWMSDDCAHPMNIGHHELRRLIWGTLTDDLL